MRKISIDELIAAERIIDLDRGDTYLISYPEFVRFYRELDVIDRHHLIVGASMVYGWMPTILGFKSRNFETVTRLVNDVKRGRRLQEGELAIVRRLINNSLVGTLKLLHFTNPDLYPIWDSKICAYIGGKTHTVNDIGTYLAYVENCEELIRDERFADIHASIERKLGYSVSPLRAVELVMFTTAKRDR
jgi:hypothetical protein